LSPWSTGTRSRLAELHRPWPEYETGTRLRGKPACSFGWGRGDRTLARVVQSHAVELSKAPVGPAGIEPAPPRLRAEHAALTPRTRCRGARPNRTARQRPAGYNRLRGHPAVAPRSEEGGDEDREDTRRPKAPLCVGHVVLTAFAAERWPGFAPGSSGWRPELLLVELPPQSGEARGIPPPSPPRFTRASRSRSLRRSGPSRARPSRRARRARTPCRRSHRRSARRRARRPASRRTAEDR
jgi:hypothetical protein